jgi:hypothetical protein
MKPWVVEHRLHIVPREHFEDFEDFKSYEFAGVRQIVRPHIPESTTIICVNVKLVCIATGSYKDPMIIVWAHLQ